MGKKILGCYLNLHTSIYNFDLIDSDVYVSTDLFQLSPLILEVFNWVSNLINLIQ